MTIASPVILRCPTCRQKMTHFTEILFTSDFMVVLTEICCEAEITSGELPVLTLIPHLKVNKGN